MSATALRGTVNETKRLLNNGGLAARARSGVTITSAEAGEVGSGYPRPSGGHQKKVDG